MNAKLRQFEDELNRVLSEADGELEIAEMIGVMQIKLHVLCTRLMTTPDADPDGPCRFLKRDNLMEDEPPAGSADLN